MISIKTFSEEVYCDRSKSERRLKVFSLLITAALVVYFVIAGSL
jgi:hypothetical protein